MGLVDKLRKHARVLGGAAVLGAGLAFSPGCATNTEVISASETSESAITNQAISAGNLLIKQDENGLLVKGKVNCWYNLRTWHQKNKVMREVRRLPWGEVVELRRWNDYEWMNEQKTRKEFTPKEISLEALSIYYETRRLQSIEANRDGSYNYQDVSIPNENVVANFGSQVKIEADGSFEVKSQDNKWKKPQERLYCIAKKEGEYPLFIKVNERIPGTNNNFSEKSQIGSVIVYNPNLFIDTDAISKFLDRALGARGAVYEISLVDRNSHMPVSARCTVECLGTPMGGVLKDEFRERQIYDIASKCLGEKKYLHDGEKLDVRGQEASFVAIDGGKYRVQTFDPNYHHVDITFTADKKNTKKAILLVDIGEKVRIDATKEGTGGEMIDGE